jgi:L-fucose isomerase-like protein
MVDEKDKQALRDALLEAVEAALDAQLRAVRRLRAGKEPKPAGRRREGMSQVDYAEDILRRAGKELHVVEIIERVARMHQVEIDRESLVSSLTKKVERGDRFVRTAPNTFALRPTR